MSKITVMVFEDVDDGWQGLVAACFIVAILALPVSAELMNGYTAR